MLTKELLGIVSEYEMPYGKHKGLQIQDLHVTEKGYLEWLSENSRDPIFKYVLAAYLDEEGKK